MPIFNLHPEKWSNILARTKGQNKAVSATFSRSPDAVPEVGVNSSRTGLRSAAGHDQPVYACPMADPLCGRHRVVYRRSAKSREARGVTVCG
jgi:hypothetical protein